MVLCMPSCSSSAGFFLTAPGFVKFLSWGSPYTNSKQNRTPDFARRMPPVPGFVWLLSHSSWFCKVSTLFSTARLISAGVCSYIPSAPAFSLTGHLMQTRRKTECRILLLVLCGSFPRLLLLDGIFLKLLLFIYMAPVVSF